MIEAKQDENGDIEMIDFEIVLATDAEIINQRVRNKCNLQLGTHQPRPTEGNKLIELTSKGLSPAVVEQSMYQALYDDEDIKSETLEIKSNVRDNSVFFDIICQAIDGTSITQSIDTLKRR